MSASASQLLSQLLDYVLEQDKDIDPRGFNLSTHKGFIKSQPDLQGLPGVDFDLKVEGDHIWLRVARLDALAPPALPAPLTGLITLSGDPHGSPPLIEEVA